MLQGILEDQPPVPLDGSGFSVNLEGRDWKVFVQDDSGLVDIMTDPESLILALPHGQEIIDWRQRYNRGDAPGSFFPTIESTLANIELSSEQSILVSENLILWRSAPRFRYAVAPQSLQEQLDEVSEGEGFVQPSRFIISYSLAN